MRTVTMLLLGGFAGLLFGLLVAWCNIQMTKHRMKRDSASPMGAVNLLRMLINMAALVLVFLLRNVIPLPWYGTVFGTATGLSVGNVFLTVKLVRSIQESAAKPEQKEKDQAKSRKVKIAPVRLYVRRDRR